MPPASGTPIPQHRNNAHDKLDRSSLSQAAATNPSDDLIRKSFQPHRPRRSKQRPYKNLIPPMQRAGPARWSFASPPPSYLPASQPHDTCAKPQQAQCAGQKRPPAVRSLAALRDDRGGGPSPEMVCNANHQHQPPGQQSTNRISVAPWCPPRLPYNRADPVQTEPDLQLSRSYRLASGARRETLHARRLARPHAPPSTVRVTFPPRPRSPCTHEPKTPPSQPVAHCCQHRGYCAWSWGNRAMTLSARGSKMVTASSRSMVCSPSPVKRAAICGHIGP